VTTPKTPPPVLLRLLAQGNGGLVSGRASFSVPACMRENGHRSARAVWATYGRALWGQLVSSAAYGGGAMNMCGGIDLGGSKNEAALQERGEA